MERNLKVAVIGDRDAFSATHTATDAAIRGAEREEQYHRNFGIAPVHRTTLHDGGFAVTGVDGVGEPRVLELPEHSFYIAIPFVPQVLSRPDAPHPLVTGLLRAAL